MGLRLRVTLWTAAIVAVSLAAGLVSARHNLRRVLEAKNDSFLERKVAELEAAAKESDGGESLTAEMRREVSAYREEGLVVMVRDHGRLEVAPGGSIGEELASIPIVRGSDDSPVTLVTQTAGEFRMIHRSLGDRSISVACSLASTEQILAQFDRRVATWSVAFLLAALGSGMLLSRLVLRPVSDSVARVRQLNPADLSTRLPLSGANDELDQLAASINTLLDLLSDYHAQVIRFTADASHELRSPLGVMRAAIEVTLQEPRTAAEYRDSLASLAEQCDQLATLVNGLLVLARADSGQLQIRREPVDLVAIAAETVEMYEPLAEERAITLSCSKADPVLVCGDRDRIRQLLSNLVENALNFTNPGGRVDLSLAVQGSAASLLVRDTGCGIPAERIPHVFERFFRADSARSGEGFGLGLSICKWIVDAHGGTIQVLESSDRGTTMRVELPFANRPNVKPIEMVAKSD